MSTNISLCLNSIDQQIVISDLSCRSMSETIAQDLPPNIFRVCGKYRLRRKLGSGSFGLSKTLVVRLFSILTLAR